VESFIPVVASADVVDVVTVVDVVAFLFAFLYQWF